MIWQLLPLRQGVGNRLPVQEVFGFDNGMPRTGSMANADKDREDGVDLFAEKFFFLFNDLDEPIDPRLVETLPQELIATFQAFELVQDTFKPPAEIGRLLVLIADSVLKDEPVAN